MQINIGIITARASLYNLQKSESKMKKYANITYLPYDNLKMLNQIYLENANRFDGFLFSGSFPVNYILENIGAISKPYVKLDITDRDYYWLFAKMFADNPAIDFSRVFFDYPEDMEPFTNIFKEHNMPFFILDDTPFYSNYRNYYDVAKEKYLTLWNSGKIDLFVLRLTNLTDWFEELKIPYYLLSPSPATIMDCFNDLISTIKNHRMENTLCACCVVKIAKPIPTAEDFDILRKMLEKFNEDQNMVFAIRRKDDLFEVSTSSAIAKAITSGYTTCLLTSVLFENQPFSTWIGWGISYDIVSAHKNALAAIKQSGHDPKRYTYLVNEKEELFGPLTGDRSISYALRPSSHATCIGKALGISPQNLEKIFSLQKKREITEFSADDLAFYLNITSRSATRIIKKLVEHGGAVPVDSLQLGGRGRPAKVYKINLETVVLYG